MIQAAAELYATSFLGDTQGRPFLFGKILDADIPLTVIFNATSFYNGENFVFQKGVNVADFVGTMQAHLSRRTQKIFVWLTLRGIVLLSGRL